jgi:endogenous inhibitor of DNA gyrase (YacG/DUF329 family)
MKFKKDIYCFIDNSYHSKISLSRLLSKLGIDKKEYYDKYMKKEGEGLCAYCGKETKFDKMKYYKFCSTYCNSRINNNLEKLHESYILEPELKRSHYEKMVQSRDNNDPNMQNAMAKRKDTYIEKYEMTESEFRKMKWDQFYNKMTDEEHFDYFSNIITKRKKGGSYKYKEYNLGDRTVLVQGYEPYVLDIITKHYSPNEISVGHENELIYYHDKANKKRRYLADIIINKRILIEVKSLYTLEKNYDVTVRKMQASLMNGFIPILVVWDKNNAEQLEKILIETISSQALIREGRFNDYPFIGVGFK